ncbi:hypothetical protein ACWE42_25290 [Sutcliffiella cohnii]
MKNKRNGKLKPVSFVYFDSITLIRFRLKFLGYSLDKIINLLKEEKQIEQSIKSIKRVIRSVEEEGEMDSTLLFSLIHGMCTDHIHEEWMDFHMLTDVVKELSKIGRR